MRTYRITFIDGLAEERITTTVRAYDYEHAEEILLDRLEAEGGTEGVEIVSISAITRS